MIKKPPNIPIDPRILGVSPQLLVLTLPDLKSAPPISVTLQLLSIYLYNNFDKDTSNPNIILLTIEDYENAILLLETIMTSINAIDLDLSSNKDTDVNLLDILDNDLQWFNRDNPIYSSPERFIDYFSRINIIRNQKAGRFNKDKWTPRRNSRDAAIVIGSRAAII